MESPGPRGALLSIPPCVLGWLEQGKPSSTHEAVILIPRAREDAGSWSLTTAGDARKLLCAQEGQLHGPWLYPAARPRAGTRRPAQPCRLQDSWGLAYIPMGGLPGGALSTLAFLPLSLSLLLCLSVLPPPTLSSWSLIGC